jgi:hypothetical protein
LNVSNNIIQNLDNLLNNIGVSSNYQINTSKIVNSYFVNTSNNIDEFLKNITLDDLQHNSSISSKLIVNNYVNALTTSNITTIGNIVPFCNLTFDLGSSNYKWRHLYLSGNSIYLDNIIISEDSAREGITIKNKNNEFVELVVSELKLYDDATQNYVSISSSNGQITATSFSNDSSILVNKPNLTTDVIPEALNASNLYYKPERVADIINSSNVISSNYIKNVGVSINSFLNNLTTDQIPEGTYKKWITNNLYTGDLSITKILTTSNLCIYHHSSVQTSNISINNLILSSDTPTLNIYQNSNQNIFELYGLSNNIVLTHDGKLGLGTTLPTQSLDVYGSIHFTGFINNIHSNQLTYLSGIKNNIIAQLSEKNINISNYVINTSNDIATNALQIISIHQSNIDKLINEISTNNSNYLEQISHSYKDKFVIIYDTIRSLESRISAYTENIRQIIEGNFQLTCNEILSNYTEINTKNPLLISNTSNSISKHIESTFLTTSNRIYDYSVKSKWSSINNNIYLNARVGINTIPSDTLDVNGNIHFKKHINNISSNEFSCLLGLISPIEEQIDTLNLVASNNISNISVDKDVLKKYNYTINLTSNLDYYTSNYISNIKQNVETNINIKFNELEQYLNNFSGPSQWNPLQYDKIYFANNVGIGTSLINNRIDVFGGDVNVVNSNVKRGDSKYQLLRWYDSPLYYTSVDKYIVYKEGQVGIGTTPIANLHVGNNTTNTLGPIVYFNKSTSLTSTSTVFNDVCAIFDSSIVVNGSIVAASDIRIKKNIIELNDDSALQKIMAISPKTYEYIDKSKGSSNIYGFIAQQINVVIPEAVSLQKEYIPNIYQYVLCNSNLIEMQDIAMSNILNIDTKIKIIDNTENVHYCKVISRDLEYNNIVIDKIFNANIFLYGTEVDDFHVVDKQYIYTLNVCATQKIVEKLNEAKTRLMALQNRYKNLYQLSN